MGLLDRIFHIDEHGTTARTEILAGVTTFVTLSYILFVQPAILAAAGMDPGAVFVATCVASAFACLLMAFLANYPIALAPGMGLNVFFAFIACGPLGFTWQQALGAVLISGLVFMGLSVVHVREHIMTALPAGIRRGIAAGIGLLIAFVGLQYAGIVVDAPGFLVGLGDLRSPPVIVALAGIVIAAVLLARRVRAALLLAMAAGTVLELLFGLARFEGVVSVPPSPAPTLLKMDIAGAFHHGGLLSLVFVFLFLDLFDTVGTLLGVSEQADLLRDGRLARAREALLADASGTVSGALLGTSTVTSYVESAAGIQAGGRTGLTSVVTAVLLLASLFFYPLVRMVGGGVEIGEGAVLYPAIAPALIAVGAFMASQAARIDWQDTTESLPAFVTMIIIPFTGSITEGIAFGIILLSVLSVARGRFRRTHWLVHVLALAFILRYVYLHR